MLQYSCGYINGTVVKSRHFLCPLPLSTCGFYGTIYDYWKPKVFGCNKSELRPLDTV